jgi:alginate O-acetyltransferase complex protein AlgI
MLEGPIAYHHEIIPQFQNDKLRKVDFDNLAKGLWLFAIGMGKKLSLQILLDFWWTTPSLISEIWERSGLLS